MHASSYACCSFCHTGGLHAILLLPHLPEPVEEEIIEVTLVPEGAQTTGDYIANPSYTAEMDALASGMCACLHACISVCVCVSVGA